MADVDSSALSGVGFDFYPTELIPETILSSGASGDVVTLTPPSGKRVSLLTLSADNAESGITITVGGVDVVASRTIASAASGTLASGRFKIGLQSGTSNLPNLTTRSVDDTIVITKDTGSTANNISYSYAYGD